MAQPINSVKDLLQVVADPEKRKLLKLQENQSRPMFGLFGDNNADKIVIPNENDITNKNEFYADQVDNTFLKPTKGFISSKESDTMAAINQYLKDTDNKDPIKIRVEEIIENYNNYKNEKDPKRLPNAQLIKDKNGNYSLGKGTNETLSYKGKQLTEGFKETGAINVLLYVGAGIGLTIAITIFFPALPIAAAAPIGFILPAAAAAGLSLVFKGPGAEAANYIIKALFDRGDSLKTEFKASALSQEKSVNLENDQKVGKANINPDKYKQDITTSNKNEMK